MKKTLFTGALALTAVAVGLLANCLVAEPGDLENPNRLSIGPAYKYSLITDSHSQPGVARSTDKANTWGVYGNYQYMQKDFLYFTVRGEWLGGRATIKSGGIGQGSSWVQDWNVLSRLGWNFAFGDEREWGVTPFIGIQYTQFSYGDTPNQFFGGKSKMYNWGMPFGLLFSWWANETWEVSLLLQGSWDFYSRSEFRQTSDSTRTHTDNKQSVAFYTELPIVYHFNETWNLALVPNYEWRTFKPKSNRDIFKSDTKANSVGIRLELGVDF